MKDRYGFYVDKLDREYREVFNQVDLYVSTQRIDENTKEEQMGQLLDMFLTAQNAGKPVEKITGKNIEAFCKAFCSEFNWKNRIYSILDSLKEMAVIFLGFSVLEMLSLILSDRTVDILQATTPAGGMLFGVVTAFIASLVSNAIVRRLMFGRKRFSMVVLKAVTWVVVAVWLVIIVALLLNNQDRLFVPVWVLTACSIGYLAIYYLVNHKRLKTQKKEKIRFSDMVGEDMEKTFPEEMEKQYQRANKRSIRRGEGELRMETFLDREERKCDNSEKYKIFYFLLPVVITALGLLMISYEGLLDMIIYAVIMLTVEYWLILECWRIEKHRCARCRKWIEEKRKEISVHKDT